MDGSVTEWKDAGDRVDGDGDEHRPRAPPESTNALQTCVERRHLGSNQTRIRFGGAPVCVQEVSQLVTEEMSIFRQTEPAERLSSPFRVKSLACVCSRGADYWFLFLCCAIAWLLLMTFSPCD